MTADGLYLVVARAANDVGISQADAMKLLRAILAENKRTSIWPRGF